MSWNHVLQRPLHLNEITAETMGGSMKVHSALGPGLLESAYEACLVHELQSRSLSVKRQVAVPIVYDGIRIPMAYRIDILVEDAVVVEIKAVKAIHPMHEAQLLSYLRLSNHKVGLLINFGEMHLRNGIVRRVNHF
jgi:GxxExxY protein